MNTIWIARIVLATILLLASARAVEMVLGWFRRARRWIWLSAMIAAIALPIVVALAPGVMPALGLEQQRTIASATASAGMPLNTTLLSEPTGQSGDVVVAPIVSMSRMASIWMASSSFLFALALIVAARLAVLRKRARPAVADGVPVRLTTNLGPLVTGYLRPAILLPVWVMDADDNERRLILAHEREHIAGGDHWLVPLGALLVIAMPWNPALWMMCARLRLAIETDCDARVIAAGADRRAYGAALIRVAEGAGPHSVLSPAWGNRARQLEQRVRAMTATHPHARALRSFVLSVGAVVLIAVAGDAAAPDAAASELPSSPGSPVKMRMATAPPAPRQATGTVRVTGHTRPSMRVRVSFDGPVGRLVVLSGRVLRRVRDVEVDIITPAEFRVDGNKTYRIVATSLESDGEVEITGAYPEGEGFPTMGSARGPAPGIRFPGAQRVSEAVQARRLAMQAREVDSAVSAAAQKIANMPRATPRPAKPGQIQIESASGNETQVRVLFADGITAIGGRPVSGAGEVIATTPFLVDFSRDGDFTAAFVSVNPAELFNADAWSAVKAWSVHSHQTMATVFCSRRGGGGIGRYVPGTPLSEVCKY